MLSGLRFAATSAIAIAALGAATIPANAQDGPGSATPKVTASPKVPVGCVLTADPPNFLTAGGKTIYATASVGPCTVPPPDSCHMTVAIASNGWSDVAYKDGGWGSCSKRLQVSYSCHDLVSHKTYHTVATLAIEYNGMTDSKVTSSSNEDLYCG